MKDLSYRVAPVVTSLPAASSSLAGVTVRLSTDNKPYWCNGTTWVDLSATGSGGAPASGSYLCVLSGESGLTNERQFINGRGTLISDNGPGNSFEIDQAFASHYARMFTDCLNVGNAVQMGDYVSVVSGTSAAITALATTLNDKAVGAANFALGTTATGRCAIWSGAAAAMNLGAPLMFHFRCRFRINTLSTATNAYTLRLGFIDSVSAESADGYFLRYTHSGASGNWQLVGRNNSAEVAVNTGFAAVAGSWFTCHIAAYNGNQAVAAMYDSSGSEHFGALAPLPWTAIPYATGRENGVGVMALRSAGTSAVNCCDIDYVETVVENINNPRW